MFRSKKHYCRSVIATFALVFGMILPALSLSADSPPLQGVHIKPIGNPTWKPVDFHLFSAPVGTASTGYAEFLDTLFALLPAPNHVFHPALTIGPGASHQPPYDSEFATSLANLGFPDKALFNLSEFSNGKGIFLTWMNVPSPGTTGASPDFVSGPIIPNSLFPIHVSVVNLHNGKAFSGAVEFDVPPLDANLDPPFSVDGHSHFPVFVADNADFGPPGGNLLGSYEYRIVMTDSSGNGWLIKAHFTVAP